MKFISDIYFCSSPNNFCLQCFNLKFGIEDFTDPGPLKIRLTSLVYCYGFAFTSVLLLSDTLCYAVSKPERGWLRNNFAPLQFNLLNIKIA